MIIIMIMMMMMMIITKFTLHNQLITIEYTF